MCLPVHWEDLHLAVYPDPEYQCYSGSALVEDDRVIIMHHGTRLGNMVATSSDPLLLNWEKVGNKAVIPMTENSDDLPYKVYDPNIWKKEGVYYSMSGGVAANGPGDRNVLCNYLFRSEDLENWEYLHPFVEGDRFTMLGDDGACPYFWPIGEKHILPFYSHMSGGQYFLGDYDTERDKFVVYDHGKFNFGPFGPSGVHAPSAAPDGKGGVICIFNMNPGKKHEGWDQIMTLPANQEIVLENISGNTMGIVAEINPGSSQMFEINVLQSPDKQEFTRIAFFQNRGMNNGRSYKRPRPKRISNQIHSQLCIESSYFSILPDARSRAPETAPISLQKGENLKLRIFIDRSIVEVFANGKQCVAMRVYPGLEDSTGVSLRSQGQSSELLSFKAYQMKSIYE